MCCHQRGPSTRSWSNRYAPCLKGPKVLLTADPGLKGLADSAQKCLASQCSRDYESERHWSQLAVRDTCSPDKHRAEHWDSRTFRKTPTCAPDKPKGPGGQTPDIAWISLRSGNPDHTRMMKFRQIEKWYPLWFLFTWLLNMAHVQMIYLLWIVVFHSKLLVYWMVVW